MSYTYNYVPNGNLETGKPARAVDLRSIRDMGPAIAMGAEGAPKIEGRALDIAAGRLTGTNALVDLDDAAQILLVASSIYTAPLDAGTVGAAVSYQLSANNGASWGAAVSIAMTNGYSIGRYSSATATGHALIDMTGFNAIRLTQQVNTVSAGSVIYTKGV